MSAGAGGCGAGSLGRRSLKRFASRLFEKLPVADEVGHAEAEGTVLPLAEKLARPPEGEIRLGDPKTIPFPLDDPEPLLRPGRDRPPRDEKAPGGKIAPANAPADLVKLGEAEPVGVLDDHHRRPLKVDSDLDDRRADEDVDRAAPQAFDRREARRRRKPAVQENAPPPPARAGRRPPSPPSAPAPSNSSPACPPATSFAAPDPATASKPANATA